MNFRECRESNLGLMGEKRKRHLCAIQKRFSEFSGFGLRQALSLRLELGSSWAQVGLRLAKFVFEPVMIQKLSLN